MLTLKINLELEAFDHPSMKEVLENKVEQLRSAHFELKTLVESLTSAGLDWNNLDEVQQDTIRALAATIFRKLES